MLKPAKLLFIVCALLFSSCGSPKDGRPNRPQSYPQDIKTTGAYLVLEWNGRKPYIMASGRLVNKEAGIFITAKHFTDEFGRMGVDYCKVFFNGKVYRAYLINVPPIRDSALIRLIEPFSSEDFPEPLPSASENPKFGELIYVLGFHPHKYEIREENASEGFPDKVIPVFENYYGQVVKDLSKESQVVFDNLPGRRIKPDPESVIKNKHLKDEERRAALEFENDSYIKVRMSRDHKFSFGGLSGGMALNEKGEVVGVITAQDILRFEYDEQGLFFIPGVGEAQVTEIKKQFFDTIYITPMDSLKELDKYIKNTK